MKPLPQPTTVLRSPVSFGDLCKDSDMTGSIMPVCILCIGIMILLQGDDSVCGENDSTCHMYQEVIMDGDIFPKEMGARVTCWITTK